MRGWGERWGVAKTEIDPAYKRFLILLQILPNSTIPPFLFPPTMSVQSAQLQPPSFTKAEKESAPEAAVYNIRMTLTSEKKAELTALAKRFEAAAAERGVRKGGIRPLPTQKLTITTRKTPNGEGSKT